MVLSWLRKLIAPKSKRARRERRLTDHPRWKKVKLYAEALEDRTLPAITYYGFALDLGTGHAAATTVDTSGNVYVTGGFYDTTTWNNTAFVAKYTAHGVLDWVDTFGTGDYSNYASPTGIAVDGSGNVYTTGEFWGTVNFDPSGTLNLTSGTVSGYENNAYVSKLDSNGNLDWAKDLGAGADYAFGSGIAVSSGKVYTTGEFQGTGYFDPSETAPALVSSTNSGSGDSSPSNAYVSALNSSDGSYAWAKALGTGGNTYGSGIAVDTSGNVYTTGGFSGTGNFNPSGTYTLTSSPPGTEDNAYVSMLTGSGSFGWAVDLNAGSDSLDGTARGDGIAVDSNYVYTTGDFSGTLNFHPGGTLQLTSPSEYNSYVSKVNKSDGSYVWATDLTAGASNAYPGNGGSIAVDGSGNVYTTGQFLGSANFSGTGTFSANNDLTCIPSGIYNTYVSKLSSSGSYVWAVDFGPGIAAGSETGSYYSAYGSGIAVDNVSGNVYTAGNFNGTVYLDPSGAHALTSSSGSEDAYLSALVQTPTFTVTDTTDSGQMHPGTDNPADDVSGHVSLRSAIAAATFDANNGISDTIGFASGLDTKTITLTQGGALLLSTTGSGTITIAGDGQITVDGGNSTSGVFEVNTGTQAIITGLTIQNGIASSGGLGSEGGGIGNAGTLTVANCHISGNSASEAGGGIGNEGTMTVAFCTISGNFAGDLGGGGIGNDGTMTVAYCTISGNTAAGSSASGDGGGIGNEGTLTVTYCTLSGNTASNDGGGIANTNVGTLTVSNSTLSTNSAYSEGGGIANKGALTVSNSTLSTNSAYSDGGGIANDGALTVSNSTFSANTTFVGGGIANEGTLTVTNSTLSGNYASFGGGGIGNDNILTLYSTIVAGNSTGGVGPDVYGTAAGSYNLIGDGDNMSGIYEGDGNDNQVGIDPTLAPLSNYGGPTQTMALLPGSPAIGTGGPIATADPISPTDTTITVSDASAIASTPGNYVIEVYYDDTFGDITKEVMLVTDVNLALNQLTVQRAYNGTTLGDFLYGGEVFLASDQRGAPRNVGAYDIGAFESESAIQGQTFVVTDPQDLDQVNGGNDATDGNDLVSLRSAVEAANYDANVGVSDTITFDPSLNLTTLMLTQGNPLDVTGGSGSITGTVTIDGFGQITVSGNDGSNGNNTSTVLVVDYGAQAIVDGLTITGGNGTKGDGADGGGIDNVGSLNLKNSTISGNTADGNGGGIFNVGSLTVNNSTIKDNSAGFNGGGIDIEGGSLYIEGGGDSSSLGNCAISSNTAGESGGGIFNGGFSVTIFNMNLSDNTAGNYGGGIDNEGGSVSVEFSTLSDNSAGESGGGIENYSYSGSLTVFDSTLSGNTDSGEFSKGGAIDNEGGFVAVNSSTLSGNSAGFGGGIENYDGTLTVTSSTLSVNSSSYNGGGIDNSGGAATVINSTIARNGAGDGGGIENEADDDGNFATLTLINTIVALNTATAPNPPNIDASVDNPVFGNNNLIGDGTGMTGITDGDNGNQVGDSVSPIDPLLTPLDNYGDNNGGTTDTLALLPGSPAIDAGGNLTTITGGDILSGDETIQVTDASVIAAALAGDGESGGIYIHGYIQIGSEVIWVWNIDVIDNLLDVYRGQNGTNPAEHDDGSGIFLATDQRGESVYNGIPDIGAFESQGFTLSLVSGNSQTATLSQAFSNPLVVSVTPNNPSEPVSGGQVTFTGPGSGAGATLNTSPATIGKNGQAHVSAIANATAGSYQVSATASGVTSAVSFNLTNSTGTPGVAYQLVFGQQPSDAAAGAANSPAVTVKIEDSYGTVVKSNTSTVTLKLSSGTFSTGSTSVTASAVSGVATFSTLKINTAGSYTLSGTDGALIGTGASNGFTINPGAANQLVFGQQPSNATAGVPINPAVTVKVEDQYFNVVTSNTSTVTLTLSSGTFSTSLSTATASAVSGVATFSSLQINTAGTYTLSGTDGSLKATGASNSFIISPGAASQLVFGQQPTNATAGVAISPAVTVKVEDQYFNVVKIDTTTVILKLSSGTFSTSSTSATASAVSGVATFSTLQINTAGTYTLSGTDGALTGTGASNSFTISPAAANQLVFSLQPSDSIAGEAISPAVTVKVEDQYFNLVPNNTSTVKLTLSSGTFSTGLSTATASAVNGVASFGNLIINTAGTYTLNGTDGTLKATGASNSFTIHPGAANQLVFGQQPTNGTAGVAISPAVTVKVEDQYFNVVKSNTSTVSLTLNSGTFSTSLSTATASAVSGVATFSTLQINTAGTYTLSGTDGALKATGFSNSFTISPAAASQLVFGQQPSDATAGVAISPAVTVKVEDQYFNVVKSNTSTVSLKLSSGTFSTGSTSATASAVSGVATFSTLKINTAGTYTLSGTDGALTGTGASNSFSINPATASAYRIGAVSTTPTAGANDQLTLTLVDQYGNTEKGFTGDKTLTFSGLSTSGTAYVPTVTNKGSNPIKQGTSELITFTNGVSTAGGVLIAYTAETKTLNVTDSSALSSTKTGGAGVSLTVKPTTATLLVFTTSPAGAYTNFPFTTQPVVKSEDVYGNVSIVGLPTVDNVTISINSGPGGGTLQGTKTYNIVALSGTIVFSGLNVSLKGTYTLKATAASGLTAGISGSFIDVDMPPINRHGL